MGRYGGIFIKIEFAIFLIALALIQSACGIQITASGGGNGESGSVMMNIEAAKDTSVSSEITINGADISPTATLSGAVPLFEQNHAVKDSTGKSASVYIKVVNAPSGLTYSSRVLPKEGTVSAQPWISAEQWLTVPKADSVKCTASASYSALSSSVGLEEYKSTVAGDYVTLTGYDGKAYASTSLVSTGQTATSGAANSIKIYGSAKDSTGTYSVNTQLNGLSSGDVTFQGLSETSSAGSTTQVEELEHLHGSFTSTAACTQHAIGLIEYSTRNSDYGTEYDLNMAAKKTTSGPAVYGILGYYVNPTLKIQGAVNAAQSGDAINVAAGTYKENVKIDKSLTVKGAGSTKTIVDGNRAGSVFTIGNLDSNTNVVLSDMKIMGGTSLNGGGVYNKGTTSIVGCTVSENSVPYYYSYGAGIANYGTITIADSTISGNSAYYNGGGIYNALGKTATIVRSTISENSAGQYGGGIINFGKLALSGSTISRNSAGVSGGGISNWVGGTATISGTTISGNSAIKWDGGGLWNAGTSTITGSTISGNSAKQSGGGICNERYGRITLGNSRVSGNNARFGGGISNVGIATISNSAVSDNSAINGGGIGNLEGTVTMTGCAITGNKATYQNGGGIYNSGVYLKGIITLSGCKITGNYAYNSGGGISTDFGTATITSSTISGNSARINGGGIYLSGTTNENSGTITGCTISGNSAGQDGGGVYTWGIAKLMDCTISSNIAGRNGGGIYDSGRSTFIGGTSQIIDNQATMGYGGGIYSYWPGVTFDGTKVAVKSNKAHLPGTGLKWYQGWGVYTAYGGIPKTANGFNPATQVTGNTHI